MDGGNFVVPLNGVDLTNVRVDPAISRVIVTVQYIATNILFHQLSLFKLAFHEHKVEDIADANNTDTNFNTGGVKYLYSSTNLC